VSYDRPLPEAIKLNDKNQLGYFEEGKGFQPYQAGRLVYDPEGHRLNMTGVLPDVERDRIVRETAPAGFVEAVKDLQKQTENREKPFTASVKLAEVPDGFDLRYAGFDERLVAFDPSTRVLSVSNLELADKDVKALLVAAGDKDFRATMDKLYVESARYKVSSWWLFWFYIVSTLGELCLSPVGLSMVSKLAPARYATMLMGLWMLTGFFGNFAAGAFGEMWGAQQYGVTWSPTPYFLYLFALLTAVSVVLFVLVRKVVRMMHGVN
jgi:POT family proton-dependent oligopeptide transporter